MKAFDILRNRKYKFNVQLRDNGKFFLVPYTQIINEIGLPDYGGLDNSREIELNPGSNGDAWFQYDFFMFGVCLNKFGRMPHNE